MQEHTRLKLIRSGTRLAWGAAAVVGVLVAIRIAWGWEASSRLEAARAAVASEKFELDPRKLLPAPIPDDQNAVVALMRSFELQHIEIPDPSRRGDGRFLGFGRIFGQMNAPRILDQLEQNAGALEELDRAAALPGAEWEVTGDGSPRPLNDEQIYSNAFDMQVLLRSAAEVWHVRGDDAQAMGYLGRLLAMARVLEAKQSLTSKQFASNMKSDAALAVDRWEPELKWTPATMEAAHRLIRALMASTEDSGEMRRAFQYETAMYSQTVMQQTPSLADWWIRPLAVDAFARRLTMQVRWLSVVEAEDWQKASALPMERQRDQSNLSNIVMTISAPRYVAADAMRAQFHAMSDARGVSLTLASKMYQQEKGKYPENLAEMVPAFLAKVPLDPFASDGRAFRYRLDPDGPTVWSVGENGKDDGGEVSLTGFPLFGGGRRYNQPDLVYGAAWRAVVTTMPGR